MNNFINKLEKEMNYTNTENGGIAHKSTLVAVYDMFAFGGAYRNRTNNDCILLFKKALEENESLAMKCLFYLRNIRGGQGERRFFRVCYYWLAQKYPAIASRNLKYIPEFGRWDDLIFLLGAGIDKEIISIIREQLNQDLLNLKDNEKGISLLAKWLPSENTSSKETKLLAKKVRTYLKMNSVRYRKMLSALRKKINVLENLMSHNQWQDIEFDKIPSKASLKYRNVFLNKKEISEKYMNFIEDKNKIVKTSTLYPYEIVNKITSHIDFRGHVCLSSQEKEILSKYWENQKDYFEGKPCKIMCVVDTSGSMTSSKRKSVTPIDVAISLGMYCAERVEGDFKNYFISFSSKPQLIKIEGIDFCDKVERIYLQNLCSNTDLKATFDLLKDICLMNRTAANDLPRTLVVISDMEIDSGSYWRNEYTRETEMEKIRKEWEEAGLEMPKLIYWNVNARHNLILDETANENISYVSGCSPIIFESVIKNKSGIQLMLDILEGELYENIR